MTVVGVDLGFDPGAVVSRFYARRFFTCFALHRCQRKRLAAP